MRGKGSGSARCLFTGLFQLADTVFELFDPGRELAVPLAGLGPEAAERRDRVSKLVHDADAHHGTILVRDDLLGHGLRDDADVRDLAELRRTLRIELLRLLDIAE